MSKKKTVYLTTLSFLCVLLGFCIYHYQTRLSKPYLTVMGYVNAADGLGRQSIELINTFKDDVSIGFYPTEKSKFRDVPDTVCKIAKKTNPHLGKIVIYETILWSPASPFYEKLKTPRQKDQIRIAYSMFESTKIPDEWVIILNSWFDAVAVPDKFLIAVYQNSGVKIPVFELPLGLELDHFMEMPLKEKAGTPFVFSNMGTCLDRKNQLILVRAFAKAFGDSPNVCLKINARYGDIDATRDLSKELTLLNHNNIQFTQFTLDKKTYLERFLNIDCYVSPSKGEGYSIQPREAMALGIPVIATNNTGQITLCESGLVRIVESKIEKPVLCGWGLYQGNGFECTEEDLIAAMKDVYENYEKYLQNRQAAREWVSQCLYKNLKVYYKSLIQPKKVILGKENKITEDSLITNSQELYDKYKELTKCE